jgi:hypothetical protein
MRSLTGIIPRARDNCELRGKAFMFESQRGEKMFERYGFKVLDRAEITKYKPFYPESVYLSTVIKNLETAKPLSAYSRVRE